MYKMSVDDLLALLKGRQKPYVHEEIAQEDISQLA
jgi:hypothetical protein